MKIAVVDNLPEGGARRVVFEQIKYLAKKNEVVYLTNEIPSIFPFDKFATVFRYKFGSKTHKKRLKIWVELDTFRSVWLSYKEISKQIRQLKTDVAIYHPCRYSQAPMGLLQKGPDNIYFAEEWYRMIYEPENHRYSNTALKYVYERKRRKLLGSLDKFLVNRAKKIITTSDYNRHNLKQAYGVDAEVIPLGVDTKVFKPPIAQTASRDYFLFIGERDDYHGYDLVKQLLSRSNNRLKIKCISFNENKFTLSDEELARTYQQAIATLCLDHKEPFGLIPLESMACGTPVIAVDEGGYKETVRQGETGYLVDRNIETLYTIVLKMSQDKENYLRLSTAARKHVIENFSWTKHGKKLDLIFRGINT